MLTDDEVGMLYEIHPMNGWPEQAEVVVVQYTEREADRWRERAARRIREVHSCKSAPA